MPSMELTANSMRSVHFISDGAYKLLTGLAPLLLPKNESPLEAMTSPLVTLICTYSERERGLEYLVKMSASVAMQNYPNLALLMVADCVKPEYFQSVDNLLQDSGVYHIRHFQSQTQNRAATLNEALGCIPANSNSWFGLLDSDDQLTHPYVISTMMQYSLGQGIYSDRIVIDADGVPGQIIRALEPHEYGWSKCLTGNYPFHLSLWQSHLLDGIRLDESLSRSADYDMVLQLLERSPELVHVPEAMYGYRVHSDRNSNNPDLQVLSSIEIVRASIKRMGGTHIARLNWVVI